MIGPQSVSFIIGVSCIRGFTVLKDYVDILTLVLTVAV